MDVLTFVPLIVIFGSNLIFPVRQDNYRPSFQPPNYVFPIMWIYISLSLGLVRGYTKISTYLLLSILGLFISWTILQHFEQNAYSFSVLILVTMVSIVYVIRLSQEIGDQIWYLLPLPLWLVIASVLSGVIYENKLMVDL